MNNNDFLKSRREEIVWHSISKSTWVYYVWLGLLIGVIAFGGYAYLLQLKEGLIVTGLRDQIFWGIYITNFVFFIGISHAGTLISSILRLTNAAWRQPITRLAEAITVASLAIGGVMPIIDMGRPERVANIVLHGRIQSNLVWDILSISTYFIGSILFLWLLMVPDIALLRDHYPNPGKLRRILYRVLSVGYNNNKAQYQILEKANRTMTIVILPLAVSVHTVVAWIFAMSLRPGWNSSIFGPYFVVGAIFSGIAASIVAMYCFRKIYHLEDYITPLHFRNLGGLLLTLTLTYLYFNINEYLTVGYKMAEHERNLIETLFSGQYAWLFWGVQSMGVIVPTFLLGFILGIKPLRERFSIEGTFLASVLVIIGAWLKRYIIVVPTLMNPHLPMQGIPAEWTSYRPTWVEWAITAAAIAGFLLIYTLISKLFPIISIWETRESEDKMETKPGIETLSYSSALKIVTMLILAIAVTLSSSTTTEAKNEPSNAQLTVLTISYTSKVVALEPEVEIVALLKTKEGKPVPDAPISFEMKALFGVLKYGMFPTDDEGKATLILHDHRYGNYEFHTVFKGDDGFAPSETTSIINFGQRPEPSLPSTGVLINPYPTFLITFPFLLFYGSCWVVFCYVGYLALWKIRHTNS